MAVLIDSGPVSATVSVDRVPREQWRELVAARRMFCAVNLPYDCRELLRFVEEARMLMGPLGYADETDFLRRGLELDPMIVGWAIEGLRTLKPDEPIPFEAAIAAGRRAEVIRAAAAQTDGTVLSKGVNQHSEGPLLRDAQRIRAQRAGVSYSTQQRLDRLAREAGDVFDGYKAGTYKSVRAAEIAAGLVRPLSILDQLLRLWAKASEDERTEFHRRIVQ